MSVAEIMALEPRIRATVVTKLSRWPSRTIDVRAPDDVVQDVMRHLLDRDRHALRGYDRSRGPLGPYVLQITRNYIRDLERAQRSRAKREGPATQDADKVPSTSEPPEDTIQRRQRVAHLRAELDRRLSTNDQLMFQLMFVDQLDDAAIAAKLAKSRGAIYTCRHRIRTVARAILDDYDRGAPA
ncbi:MAG: sigma-70 family RNA polymerase sigma factor [Deltaproteobacteria bacterium]